MHWELSEEQDLFITSLREWLQERAGPRRSAVGWTPAIPQASSSSSSARAGPGSASTRTSAARAVACSNWR